jgi:hypothetical protein
MLLSFTHYPNKFATNGKEEKLTFSQFANVFLQRDIRLKKEGKLFAPAIFDGKRAKKNVQWVTMLCFDIDDGTQYQPPQTNYAFASYTTHSHTPQLHKWRLIFPLERPIPAEHWRYAYKAANQFWRTLYNTGSIDTQCSDSSRMYYAPSCPPNMVEHAKADYQAGEKLQLCYDHIIREQEKRQEEYKRIQAAKAKFKQQNTRRHSTYWELKREAQIEYATNENYRRHLAESIGTINGDKVENFDCPVCGRNDATFYFLNPNNNSHRAYCAHVESCGTPGDITKFSVYSLAAYNGFV